MVRTAITKQEQAEEIKSLKRYIAELEKREAEHQKYKQALYEIEQRYKLLSDNIIDIVWMMDIKTQKFDYISPSIERISGFTQRDAMRLTLSETVTPVSYEYAISVLSEELKREKHPGIDPNRLRTLQLEEICKDGSIIQVEAQLRFLRDAAGILTHVVGITRDVSERNRVEKALRDSEERFHRQAENSPDIIYHFRLLPEPTLEYFNPAVTTILGYSEEEVRAGIGFIFNLMQSEDRKVAEGIITSSEKQQQQPLTLEIKHKNGTPVWLEIRYVPVLDRSGNVEILEGIARDVTERKLAEKARMESEERLRIMMEASSEGFIICDGEKVLDINERGALKFGYKPGDMVGKNLADIVDQESLQLIKNNIAENYTKPYEVVFRRQNVFTFPAEIRVRKTTYKGDNILLIAFRDLTLQKQYENLLENIVVNAPTSMSVVQDEKFKFVNKRFLIDTGYTESEIQSMNIMQCVYPEDRELMTRNVSQMLLGRRIEPFEFRTVNKSGEIRWVLQSSTLITYNNRLATLSMYVDITEQKKNEAALRESEQKYRILSDNAADVVSTLNLKTLMFDYISPSVERVHGYTLAEAKSLPLDRALTPVSFENCMKILSEEMARDSDPGVDPERIRTVELEQVRKDGSVVPMEARLKFLRDNKGVPTHVISSSRDITERKRDEARLKQSEENLATYINNAPAGVYICDLKGILIYGNKKAEEIMGFKQEEFIGKSFWDLGILPEQSQVKAFALQERNTKGITTGPDEFKIIKKDGSLIWVEVTTTPITQRGVTLLIGYARDITDRKKAEEALRISEENYRNSIDHSPMGVVVFDDNEKILYANRAIIDIYGFESVEELQNTPIKERYTPESYKDYLTRSEKFKKDRASTSYELSIRRKDSSIRYLHAFRNEILWGGERRYQLLYNDITDQRRVQEALRISEENFHNSIDNSSVGIMVFTLNEDIIYANRALLDIYGYEKIDELKNTPLEERYTPKTYAEYLVRHEAFINGQTGPLDYELDVVRKDGTIRHVRASRREVIWGREKQYQIIYNDITEQKKVEDEIRESQLRFRELARLLPLGIWETDERGILTYTNEEAMRTYGYSRQDTRPLAYIATLVPQDRERARRNARRILRGESIGGIEYLSMRKDGNTFPSRVYASPVVRNGKSVGMRGITIDITEQKNAEKKLQEAAQEWRTTFDSITDMVSILDNNSRIVRVNKAYNDFLKQESQELVSKKCYELIHGANCPYPDCPHQKTLQTGKSARAEFYETALGAYIEVSTSPIFGEDGSVHGSVHVMRDISERKQMEQQLMLTDRLASVGELASGVAHELNNPLASIVILTQLLVEREMPDDVKEDLGLIGVEAQRAANIVKNLLTFARKHTAVKQASKITNMIEDVLKLRAYEQNVDNITVIKNYADDLPEIMVDYFQMQQVFINLIINAEYFMSETHGRGTLTIGIERIDSAVRISFADDGPGIPKENLNRIFDPFFTTKEVGKGTGLGLSICHGIIAEHGGRIYAESEVGKGTTFIVELPINGN